MGMKLLTALAVTFVAAFAAVSADAAEPYRLQVGDRIEVTVLEDPTLDRRMLVRPDGRVSMPIAGSLVAAGRTPEELQSVVISSLKSSFAFEPTVTVSVTEADETVLPAVYVIGQVSAPGRIELRQPLTLLQALAIAGGPTPFAATSRIQIRRGADDAESILTYDYGAVEDGLSGVRNLSLLDGDVIIVPERGLFD